MADLAFAFGCFHFGLKRVPISSLNIRRFMTEVENALKAIPNVDNVRIDCNPEAYNEAVTFKGEPPDLSVDGPFPYLPYGTVAFDVLIPLGAQRELLKGISREPLTFTELFQIEIFYEYHFPVAVVRLIDPRSEPDPSNAVIIIRELLQREFERQQQSLIDFQFLGPSPLHADLYLTGEPRGSNGLGSCDFSLDIRHLRGYDRYDFTFNENIFKDAKEALDDLLIDILPEVDVHYLIDSIEHGKIGAWQQIDTRTRSLTDLQQRKRFKGSLTKSFKVTRLVNDAFVSLAEFEGTAILMDNMLRNTYRQVYSSDTNPYLREIIDGRMEERASYPTEQVRSLLQLFETRRLSSLELRVVLISAITGGVFGGIVSGLFGGN